jgi:hypothetical protein
MVGVARVAFFENSRSKDGATYGYGPLIVEREFRQAFHQVVWEFETFAV